MQLCKVAMHVINMVIEEKYAHESHVNENFKTCFILYERNFPKIHQSTNCVILNKGKVIKKI